MQLFKIDLELSFKENSLHKKMILLFMVSTKQYCYRYYKDIEIRDIKIDFDKGIFCYQIYFAVSDNPQDTVIEFLYSILNDPPQFILKNVILFKQSIELVIDKKIKLGVLKNIERIKSDDNRQKLMSDLNRDFKALFMKFYPIKSN